jgi:DNA-nicking Smr family endonuclease
MRAPRGLTPAEAALWARVASTVAPLESRLAKAAAKVAEPASVPVVVTKPRGRIPPPLLAPPPRTDPVRPLDRYGLDGSWERKLAKAQLSPDFTLDLHGHSLEAAHARLDTGLAQAAAMGARLVLVITGKPRPVAAADRSERRGAIRAKLLDWLAAGPHAARIAAVRTAHQRHGGSGAVYVVLRRQK